MFTPPREYDGGQAGRRVGSPVTRAREQGDHSGSLPGTVGATRGGGAVAVVFITGSSDGLGLMAARLLISQGHEVLLHGRNEARSRDALAAAGRAKGVVSGDLSTIAGARTVADQVNKLGRVHAVIHNARVGYREDRAWSSERLRSQCTGAVHSHRTDRKAEAVGLCELRHAPRRPPTYRRFTLDQAILERRIG